MPTVVCVGTLDTKGREYKYVMDCLLESGVTPLMIDFGVLESPPFKPDIGAEEVARAGGADLQSLRESSKGEEARADALDTMACGLIEILKKLLHEDRCDAVFGLGGSGGSSVISAAMRTLPLGVPKLLLSTMASGDVGPYVGTKDICIMHSVTDIAGLNRISRPILQNAAHAVAGMAQGDPLVQEDGQPLIGVTMMGITTPGALRIIDQLEMAGFETVVFHANGSGGRAMEELIEEGLIDGVIEYTLRELTAYELGGEFHAGPNRLEAAGRQGIPQVVVPGGIEVLNFGARDTVPDKYDRPERQIIIHNPSVCAARINKTESIHLGNVIAKKLNAATGPTSVLVPLNGFDMYQAPPDGRWIDREKDAAFLEALRSNLREDIQMLELDAYINEKRFADAAVEEFFRLWTKYQPGRKDDG
jgi:uncharacterized protein (UPF0261 family)